LVSLFSLGFRYTLINTYLAFPDIGLLEHMEFSLKVAWDLILEQEFEEKGEGEILKTQHIST